MPSSPSVAHHSKHPAAAPIRNAPTGTQLATAFDGPLEPVRTTLGYRLAALLVFVAMLLLPVVYLAIIAAAALGVAWYAVHATVMFSAVPPGRVMLLIGVAYVAPIFAGGLVVLFMILPLFWRSKKITRPMWVDRKEQPLLYAYIDKLCDTMRAPRPVRIDVTAAANASAHIDNGLLGLINRRLVLTIGLPLAQSMDLRQFTGVLAHELGHFCQGGSMRVSYAVHRIDGWFFRLAYARNGVDDAVNSVIGHNAHWTLTLIALIAKLMLGLTRCLLKLMAIISHALSMHLSRQAEFDADRQAASIVGSEPMGEALQTVPFISTASDIAMHRAQAGWKHRTLPDDLVVMTDVLTRAMPAKTRDQITAKLLAHDTQWFDTHPPLFQRVGTLKKAGMTGVLKLHAPAECLFRDFDELSKLATMSLYQTALGERLQPEHLVPTDIASLVNATKPTAR